MGDSDSDGYQDNEEWWDGIDPSDADGRRRVMVVFYVNTDIPTLSEWAMIIFAVVILALMTYVVVRRRRSLQPTTA